MDIVSYILNFKGFCTEDASRTFPKTDLPVFIMDIGMYERIHLALSSFATFDGSSSLLSFFLTQKKEQ
jgi:hypothetical protein